MQVFIQIYDTKKRRALQLLKVLISNTWLLEMGDSVKKNTPLSLEKPSPSVLQSCDRSILCGKAANTKIKTWGSHGYFSSKEKGWGAVGHQSKDLDIREKVYRQKITVIG